MLTNVPDVTPSGKPVKEGVVVATPAVPVLATAVAAWICAADVVPPRPLNTTFIAMVFNVVSMVTVPLPTPSEAFAGDSFGPDMLTL